MDCSFGPSCIDPIFGPTAASNYWSPTTFANDPGSAWFVNFGNAYIGFDSKDSYEHVRAVRTGP